MKKLMCILLAVLLASSAGITVPAEGSDPEAADPYVIDKPELGFTASFRSGRLTMPSRRKTLTSTMTTLTPGWTRW